MFTPSEEVASIHPTMGRLGRSSHPKLAFEFLCRSPDYVTAARRRLSHHCALPASVATEAGDARKQDDEADDDEDRHEQRTEKDVAEHAVVINRCIHTSWSVDQPLGRRGDVTSYAAVWRRSRRLSAGRSLVQRGTRAIRHPSVERHRTGSARQTLGIRSVLRRRTGALDP